MKTAVTKPDIARPVVAVINSEHLLEGGGFPVQGLSLQQICCKWTHFCCSIIWAP